MNNIFQNARLKLTVWYLLILMAVSFVFSVVVFYALNAELERNARREQQKVVAEKLKIILPKPLPDPDKLPKELVDPQLNIEIEKNLTDSRNTLLLQIVLANILVLGLSASASYFLSGITLKPIEIMVEEQKQFIANASHEFRTPLATLKTALEVTLRLGPIPYDRVKSLLESNLEDVNNLESLTKNLLVIEKYSRGLYKNTPKIIQFDSLIEDCTRRITPKAELNQIKVFARTVPTSIKGDKQGLEEMLNNFLENAIKYNKTGGKIELILNHQNNMAVLEIKDTGIGIENSDIPHIFERFFRSDYSRTKNGIGGYGLGLHIASQIIKQHNGKVSVRSTLQEGSTFTIGLPISK